MSTTLQHYQYLKGRKGEKLTYKEIENFQMTVSALKETIKLQDGIETTIKEFGGWEKLMKTLLPSGIASSAEIKEVQNLIKKVGKKVKTKKHTAKKAI